jgi:hypothetical protein
MSEVIDTTEQLFDLFVAECDRTKSEPSISDFSVWLSDKGYQDDLSSVYGWGE